MKCTKCGLREATTEVLHRHNNHVEKMFLCDECARDFGPDVMFDDFDMDDFINASPMGLVNDLVGFIGGKSQVLVCPDCKTTSDEFLRTGFVGCPRCYEVFEPLVIKTVKQLQQSDRHIGKMPVGAVDVAAEEARLKGMLRSAVDACDYNAVAEISKSLERLRSGQDKEGK